MTNTNLTIRPAHAADRDAVFAMIATVWDGDDYIPQVWDSWLGATTGPLLVGTLDGRVVALSKLTALTTSEDWLEGVRVDPDYRGRGLARTMIRHCVDVSRERGGVLRYSTSSRNLTMQRLGVELGFTLAYAPDWYGATATVGTPQTRALPPASLPALLDRLEGSRLLALTGGLYTYNWNSVELTEERLRERLAAGQVVGLPGGSAWAIRVPSRWGGAWIAHAEGRSDELARLFTALRRTDEPFEGEAFIRAHVPADAPQLPALHEAGYTLGDHAACIFEYRL